MEGLAKLLSFLVLYTIAAVIMGLLAARKNRNGWIWGLVGGLFLLPGLLVLMFAPYLCPKCLQSISNKEWARKTCPRCGEIGSEREMGAAKDYSTEPAECVSCGAIIPPNEEECSNCGWSYSNASAEAQPLRSSPL